MVGGDYRLPVHPAIVLLAANQTSRFPVQDGDMRTNRPTPLSSLVVTAFLAVTLVLTGASPSEPPPGTIISGRTKVKDKSKPVRAALETRYAAMVEAYRRKNPDVVLDLRTKDFHVHMPSGEIWSAERSAQYTLAGFAQVESTLSLTFDIGIIDVHGDTAAAEIDQHWVRRQQKNGAVRLVDTRAHQRETWVNSGKQWLLWRIDRIEPGAWIVDGKRIDPSKPYDPKAPAWLPPDK